MNFNVVEMQLKKLMDLEKKLESYFKMLKVDNELTFIMNGTYLVEDELQNILNGIY